MHDFVYRCLKLKLRVFHFTLTHSFTLSFSLAHASERALNSNSFEHSSQLFGIRAAVIKYLKIKRTKLIKLKLFWWYGRLQCRATVLYISVKHMVRYYSYDGRRNSMIHKAKWIIVHKVFLCLCVCIKIKPIYFFPFTTFLAFFLRLYVKSTQPLRYTLGKTD